MAVQEHTGWERKNSMNKIAILDAATQSVQYQDDDGTEYPVDDAVLKAAGNVLKL